MDDILILLSDVSGTDLAGVALAVLGGAAAYFRLHRFRGRVRVDEMRVRVGRYEVVIRRR